MYRNSEPTEFLVLNVPSELICSMCIAKLFPVLVSQITITNLNKLIFRFPKTSRIPTKTIPSPNTNPTNRFESEGGVEQREVGLAVCEGRSEEVPATKKEEVPQVKQTSHFSL